MRKETEIWGPVGKRCDRTLINAVNKKIEEVCFKNSFCVNAYAFAFDFCPIALWSYGTSNCREACLMDLEESLNSISEDVCVVSNVGLSGRFCNDTAWRASNTTEFCSQKDWRQEEQT